MKQCFDKLIKMNKTNHKMNKNASLKASNFGGGGMRTRISLDSG